MPGGEILARRGRAQIAQRFERAQQHGQRRAARGQAREMRGLEARRGSLDEPLHEQVMVLHGRLSEQAAHLEERGGVGLKPVLARTRVDHREELVHQAAVGHARAQARLILGQHEQHLVDEQLRVVRIAGPAQAEQEIEFVDAGEVPGVGAAILLPAHPVGLVVRPHAIEEPLHVESREQALVEAQHAVQRLPGRFEQNVGDRARDAERYDAPQRIRGTLQR